MKFIIENGLGFLSIRLSRGANYLHFREPINAIWADNRGGGSSYFCLFPNSEQLRQQINDLIPWNLDNWSDNIESIKNELTPLFQIFTTGEYYLSLRKDDRFPYQVGLGETTYYSNWFIEFVENGLIDSNSLNKILSEHFTHSFYEGRDNCFIATKDRNLINNQTVKFFEEEIKKGKKPLAIIFAAHIEEDLIYSNDYILDGHHKLLAYANLKIPPSYITIYHLQTPESAEKFELEELTKKLYPWQVEHLLKYR